jgi:hypothetical protein
MQTNENNGDGDETVTDDNDIQEVFRLSSKIKYQQQQKNSIYRGFSCPSSLLQTAFVTGVKNQLKKITMTNRISLCRFCITI